MNNQFKTWVEEMLEVCERAYQRNHPHRTNADPNLFEYFGGKVDALETILRYLDENGNYIPLVDVDETIDLWNDPNDQP